MRLIKNHRGSSAWFEHEYGYILQAPDRRVVFVLPFAQDFTLIGTTDENFVGDLNSVARSRPRLPILRSGESVFPRQVIPDELVWSFSGTRALRRQCRQAGDVTRD
jgi:glycerol-3-phosphate dehydrogenase